MLEGIRTLIQTHPGREEFFTLIDQRFPRGSDEYHLITRAYDVAKNAFRHKIREDKEGTRYFEHLRAVVLIIMVYMRVRDANIIAAALLHDIIEDIPGWTQDRVALEFNRTVSQLVYWVTKPPVEVFDGDKEARNRAYHQNLSRAPRDALKIKLADRLHNVLTLWDVDADKQRRKVRETQDFYLTLAEEQFLLIHELESALDEIMKSWAVLKKT